MFLVFTVVVSWVEYRISVLSIDPVTLFDLIHESVLEARRLPLKLTTLRFGSRLHGDADPCAVVASVIERIMILEREICS